jgi:hypothetical protein
VSKQPYAALLWWIGTVIPSMKVPYILKTQIADRFCKLPQPSSVNKMLQKWLKSNKTGKWRQLKSEFQILLNIFSPQCDKEN